MMPWAEVIVKLRKNKCKDGIIKKKKLRLIYELPCLVLLNTLHTHTNS